MRLEVVETGIRQGQDEKIPYALTTTPWGSDPTDVEITAYDTSASYDEVTATILSGDAAVDGDVITTPTVTSLTIGHTYRIEIKFTAGAKVLECFFLIKGQR